MGNYEQLKQAVSDVIKTNGNQEITGAILQNALLTIISAIGDNATFKGIATPSTNPGTPDQNVFYIAFEDGTYSNFNGAILDSEVAIFVNENNSWVKKETQILTKSAINNIPLNSDFISGDFSVIDNKINIVSSETINYTKIDCSNIPYLITKNNFTITPNSEIVWADENDNLVKGFIYKSKGAQIAANAILKRPYKAKYLYIKKSVNEKLKLEMPLWFKDMYPMQINENSYIYTYENFTKGEFSFTPTVGNALAYSYNSGFASLMILFKTGEKVVLDGIVGGWNARAYVLLDKNFKAISFAAGNTTLNNTEVIAPENCEYMLVQTKITAGYNIRVTRKFDNQIVESKIKILSISNSYGCDAMGYVPQVLKNLGINNYECAVAFHAGASLQNHVENIGKNYYTYYYTVNGLWQNKTNKNLLYILKNQKWDYIVFQQNSANSNKYISYEPYLTELMKYVAENIDYKTKFAFNMTQQHPAENETMLDGIKDAAKQVYENFGLPIIPVGITVQNARGTSLNQYGEELTSDGTHLEDGIGRLLASYTWIKFLLNIDIWNAKYYPQYPLDITIPDGPRKSFTNVTEEMAWIAKTCVGKAIRQLETLLINN